MIDVALLLAGIAATVTVGGLRAQQDDFVVHRVKLSPDAGGAAFGRVTEAGSGGQLLWRAAGVAAPVSLGRAPIVRAIAFAPDGGSVFATEDRGAVKQFAMDGRVERTFELGQLPGFCNDVAVSRDGQLMFVCDQEKRLQGFHIDSGERVFSHTLSAQPLCLAVAADDDVFVGHGNGHVTRWSPTGERRVWRGIAAGNVMRLSTSRDGRWLAAASWNGSIAVFDLAGGAQRDLPKTGERIYALAFSPDGRQLAAAGGREVVVHVLRPGRAAIHIPRERAIGDLAFRLADDDSAVLIGADYRGGIHELTRVSLELYPQLVTSATRADQGELARLQRPGKVVFVDRFESEQSFANYFEVQGRDDGRVTIARGSENVHAGTGSLQLTATENDGKARGAGPVLWLGDRTASGGGYECLHLRYWIRYAADYDQGNLHHTGGSLSGVIGTDKWGGMGGAGKRPQGDDHFSTRVEGWREWGRREPPGYLHCYSYWMDMRRDRDGNYWGNMMAPEPADRVVPARAQWQCVELRVRGNTVTDEGCDADGELAVWLDGRLYQHWRGFRWRSDAGVLLKRVGLLCYVHEARQDNTVWFDDVVVSTGYIGTETVPAGAGK